MIERSREPGFELDPGAIRRAFDRASARYDESAILQAEIRSRLLDRLELVRMDPNLIVDVGAGTGHASAVLAGKYRRSRVCALDIAEGMLRETRRNEPAERVIELICGDAARLPFSDRSVDLIFCNLVLQWCNDIDQVFREFRRVIAPHGLLSFTTFGPDTLNELREAWRAVDEHTHVNRFVDMHDIGDALVRAGLAEPVIDVEHFTLTYPDVLSLMRDLKAIGAHNVTRGRPHGLTGRRRLEAVRAAYERYRIGGSLPATYEVVYGQAWGAVEGATARVEDGEVHLPVSRIGRRGSAE